MTDCPIMGTVIAVQANYYRVVLDNDPNAQPLLCTRRAILKKMGQSVCVGDRVQVSEIYGDRAVVFAVAQRASLLTRPAIANLQQILLIAALAEPALDPWQISRFLVYAETAGVPLSVGLSKADLVSADFAQAWVDRLALWGYRAIVFSTSSHLGISELAQSIGTGITLLTGQSGVGKSSLLNALNPNLQLATGAISPHQKTGRHTTRHVELFAVGARTFLADSPGFLQPALHLSPHQLAQCFPEVERRLASTSCQFADCRHEYEPDCAVRGDWERYEHYLAWLAELDRCASSSPSDHAPTLKTKAPKGGKARQEVLFAKKHRHISRRTHAIHLDRELADELLEPN